MAAFEYLALDDNGRSRKGVLTGESPRQIRSQLRDLGLYPVQVEPVADTDSDRPNIIFTRKVPVSSLALMTRQLATLVRSGMPLEESLRVLGEQVKLPRLQSVVAGLRSHIMEGANLADSLAKFPEVFPEYYWTMVEAGEASGRLDDILERLADYTEQQYYLRQKVGVAMIYPVILTLVAFSVVIALLTYVVPEVVRVFAYSDQTLPLLTRWMIACSDFLRDYGFIMMGVFVICLFVWSRLMRRSGPRFKRDSLLLRIPYVGDLIRIANSARLARILAILTDSGVTLVDALGIGVKIVRNIPIRQAIINAADRLREGGRLHRALDNTSYFPPLLIHMISVGEESGELEKMLDRAATHYEREMATAIAAFTSLVEPVLILLMGAMVLIIVLAILLPIFEMNQLVGI
jgi:general secretion pathway protein F